MSGRDDDDAALRVPIVEERLRVSKDKVVTGSVRVASHLVSETQPVREMLESVRVRVERVAVDRFVDEAPPVRTLGDRTIVSVTEEVLVKRIRLVEEIHLIETRDVAPFDEDVTLRRTEVEVTRD